MTFLPENTTKPVLAIRSVGPEAFEEMATLWTRAQAARGVTATEALDRFRDRAKTPDAWFAAGKVDGQIVAFGHGLWAREKDGEGEPIPGLMHLAMVAVDPEYWGRGYGRKMTEFSVALSGVLGYRAIQLWTQVSNERAIALYRSLGFIAIGRVKAYAGETIALYFLDMGERG